MLDDIEVMLVKYILQTFLFVSGYFSTVVDKLLTGLREKACDSNFIEKRIK